MKGFLKNGLAAAIQIAVFSTFLGAWGVSHAQTSDTNRLLMEGIEYATLMACQPRFSFMGSAGVIPGSWHLPIAMNKPH